MITARIKEVMAERDALRAKSDEGWALVDELTEALARANRMMTGEDAAAVEVDE